MRLPKHLERNPLISSFLLIVWIFSIVVLAKKSFMTHGYDVTHEDLKTLQQLYIIFRHGDRTPDPESGYKLDPYKLEEYYPYGKGELTLNGKRNAYEFGMSIRERYQHFIPKIYFPPEVNAYTTNSSRTQMTLQTVLTAIYPPVYPDVIKHDLMWQPISYNTLSTKEDDILNSRILYADDFHNFTTKMNNKLRRLYDYVEKNTGNVLRNSYDLLDIYDTLLVQKEMGLVLPPWAEEIFNNGTMKEATLEVWPDLIKNKLPLITGKLINKIISDSRASINNENSPKLYLYSAHDINTGALLGVFGIQVKMQIEYLSHWILELHKIDEHYGFKIYFRNGLSNPLIPIKFRSSKDYFCKIEDFIKYTKHLYTDDTLLHK